ncbi:MAG: caspase family protein, partial [Armatimonadetes bacterium]|nr:caspase family protein [Armatimonadota bacterium]
DGFGGTNAALQGRLAAGTFVVFATSYDAGASGSYSLTVKEAQPPSEAGEGVAFSASMEPGNTYEGELTDNDPTLDDGTHYQLIRFQGRAGDEMTATLSSEDFDPYLILALGNGDLSGLERLTENDDADTATVNSQITFPLPADGIYTLVVNSYEEDTGAYELHLETAAPDYSRFSAGDTDPEGRYALIVGIDDYPGTGSDLTGPTHDAEMMAQVLLDGYMFEPQNVILLENEEATRLNIANGIIRHLGKAGRNGVAVFFFSGHGTRVGRNVGFLDNEADGQDDGIYVYGHGGESSIILDEELGYLLSQLKGNTFVAVDACYSGTISRAEGGPQAKSADINSPDVANNIRLPKTFISDELGAGYAFGSSAGDVSSVFNQPQRSVVMSSSSEEQVSWTVNDWPDGSRPASLFTYYLAKEMRNATGAVTFRDLLRRVSQQVDAYVSNSGGKYEAQTAQLAGPGLERPIRSFMLGF